jgi:hypothetical protein
MEAIFVPKDAEPDAVETVLAPVDTEAQLEALFSDERIGQLAEEYLTGGNPEGLNLKEMAGDRQFVVAYIPAESPYADIPRSVETKVFAKAFKQSLTEVVEDYGKYDSESVFATVIDVSAPVPTAAAALRITHYNPELGVKDVNDLLVDNPENPWIQEIKDNYFADGEAYNPALAWKRLGEKAIGAELVLEDSLDIATHASAEGYNGQHGEMGGASMLFYHACLRYALAHGKKNLLAIFDLPPLANLQQFGDPFDTYEGLEAHPYGGPYDTIPAFCVMETGMQRIRDNNEWVGQGFIDGIGLDQHALLPNEYQPEIYSNEAVNL